MKTLIKTSLILLFFFSLRLVQSCLNCPEDYIAFDFSTVIVHNVDNSGTYTTWASSDTMYSAAVAFEIQVDGDLLSMDFNKSFNNMFSFSGALAMEECATLFTAKNTIANISIITLNEMSDMVHANTDVTELFLGKTNDFLYTGLDEIIPFINQKVYGGYPRTSFQIFCRENIKNSVAQFIIRIELSNGEIISGASSLVHIRGEK
jgi:hypothetical protein